MAAAERGAALLGIQRQLEGGGHWDQPALLDPAAIMEAALQVTTSKGWCWNFQRDSLVGLGATA